MASRNKGYFSGNSRLWGTNRDNSPFSSKCRRSHSTAGRLRYNSRFLLTSSSKYAGFLERFQNATQATR